MRNFIVLFFAALLFIPSVIWGQMHNGLFGNEWINYSQPYYKMKVSSDGLYQISTQALQNAGINVSNLVPGNLQVFHMGQEIPIHVNTNSGQVANIQFYGKKHRGEMDVNLYRKAAHHFNTEYSAISDTAAYFLTWNNTGSSRQYTQRSADLSNLPAKENFFMHESKAVSTTNWQKGKEYQISTELLTKSTYEYGEGWGTNKSVNQNVSMSIVNLYATGPAATGRVRAYSIGFILHNISVAIGGNTVYNNTFSGDSVLTHSFNIPLSSLSGTTTFNVRGNASSSDYNSISWASIEYPRTFDFGGAASFYFKMPASATRKYLEITNFNGAGASAQTIYLYDLTNGIRTQCFWDGSRVLTDLPPSSVDRELVLVNEANPSGYRIMGRVDATNFIDYTSANGDYLIISHPKLFTNSSGNNPIIEYAAYRASTGFNPVVIDIFQLYDQFGYGIDMHPVSIRNFAAYVKLNWTDPQYVFLIGKGRNYYDMRAFNTYDHLIPTFGYPPSDNLLFSALGTDVPTVPVGRLAATTGDQVSLYLQKIRDLESEQSAAQTLADRGWMKNVVHLGGGRNSSEQNIIRQNLDGMKSVAEGPYLGALVTSFFKTSTNPIQAAQSAFLDSLINSGVSLITFYGHSSANSFDFNLDRPENYNNYKRYPMFISLGCYGGTVFENGMRISESFVFEPNAGASVFLASVGAASLSALNIFALQFYYNLSNTHYGKGGAKMVQQAIENLENSPSYSTTVQMVCHYMNYHGDPAYKFNVQKRPDYYIDMNLVSHQPSLVTAQMTTFDLVLDIHNLGKAIDTVFYVEITREFPNGNVAFVSKQQIQAPHHSDRVYITVPVEGTLALGINYFNIKIDSDNEVAEEPNPAAEQNNSVIRYPIHILSDAILPVYPPEFAIVPNQPINLKASTGNSFAPMMTYRIQIDTTEYFNSPLFQETTKTQIGGIVDWTPNLTYIDSTVYYWRVSPDSIDPVIGFSWEGSSFIYIDGSYPGWNQSHFFQYQKDAFRNIELLEPNRQFNFITSLQEITLSNGFTPTPLHPEQLATYLNGNLVDKCRCYARNGTYVMVIDSSNLNIWTLPGGTSRYGAVNCDGANRDAYVFLFETTVPSKRVALENFLRDSIPNGFYVLVYSLNDADADNWPSTLTNLLQGQGSTQIGNLAAIPGGLPWAFFYQKNTPAFPYRSEALGQNTSEVIGLSCLMPGNWDSGTLESTIIGPAQNWYSFHWRTSTPDGFPTDYVSVDVYGIESSGTRTLLMPNLLTLDTAITSISAAQYPHLQLIWKTGDVVNKTSAQLDYWRILADMAPEAALRPDIFFSLQSDTLQQGMTLSFEVMMQNISSIDMDSMLIKYKIVESNDVYYKRIGPLPAGDTLRSTALTIPTLDLVGPLQLLVEINPDNDQLEMYHFNNIALVNFFVARDIINPLLDVTFDGVRIMNGDLVSGKTQVVISLTDENQYLGLDKLEDFKIILRNPNFQNSETQLVDGNPVVTNMTFYPADLSRLGVENKARIVIDLDLEWDGKYTLFVSATDKSGNNSGALDYSVDFNIINTSMISNVLNYPNPFTTQTQFVFTLTGRELPEYMKMQIMTVTGKIVREISMEELGPIHIGVNKTDFVWDGTDSYGDRLANGVYLYRVITKAKKEDTENLKFYNTPGSYMFTKGFGKMYLMR